MTLEQRVIDLVEECAEHEEGRSGDQAAEKRVQPEMRVEQKDRKAAQDDEGRVREVRNVQHAEGDLDAERDCRVEAAQQQSGGGGVQQQPGELVHLSVRCP